MNNKKILWILPLMILLLLSMASAMFYPMVDKSLTHPYTDNDPLSTGYEVYRLVDGDLQSESYKNPFLDGGFIAINFTTPYVVERIVLEEVSDGTGLNNPFHVETIGSLDGVNTSINLSQRIDSTEGAGQTINFSGLNNTYDKIYFVYLPNSAYTRYMLGEATIYGELASEVLTTNITSIYLNPNGTVYGDEASLKGVVTLNQTSGIYLNYTYYVNGINVSSGQDTTPSTITIPNLNPSNFEHRDEVIVSAIAVNSSNQSQRLSLPRNSSTLTIANYAPTVTASLSPLTALNDTDVRAYCAISDSDSGELMNISWAVYDDDGLIHPNTVTESHGISLTTGFTDSLKYGIGINLNDDTDEYYVTSVTKVSGVTATKAYLIDDTDTIVETVTFSGDVATFTNKIFIADNYKIKLDNDGASYNLLGSATGQGTYTGEIINIVALTDTRYYNIESVTVQNDLSGNLTSKTEGSYNVGNISNLDTEIGNNYSIQCNVTDGYLTDTDTSATLTITDLLNFTVTAVNEWTSNPINNFSIFIPDVYETRTFISDDYNVSAYYNSYNITYDGSTYSVPDSCLNDYYSNKLRFSYNAFNFLDCLVYSDATTFTNENIVPSYTENDLFDLVGYNINLSTTNGSIITPIDNPWSINNNDWVSRYELNNTVTDSWGSNDGTVSGTTLNDGTVSGATLTTDKNGRSNSAYSFDGVNDAVLTSYDLTNSPEFSFSVWVYNIESTYTEDRYILASSDGGLSFYYDAPNRFRVDTAGLTDTVIVGGTPIYEEWVNYVFTYDGSNRILYKNSILEIQESATGNITFENISISKTGIHTWNGSIDDVHIYNRALSSTEIGELYENSTFYNAKIGDGLVAYYNFNGNANDTHNYITGREGGNTASYNFDGVNDYVAVSDIANFNNTFCTWFKWNGEGSSVQSILSFSPTSDRRYLGLTTTDNTLRIRFDSYYSYGYGTGYDDNNWHHVCAYISDDVTNTFVYVDGSLETASIQNDVAPTTMDDFNIGSNDDGDIPFNGSLQDLMIFDRTLTPTEINKIYEEGITYNPYINVTITSDDYFNRTYSDWNLSNNLVASIYQSEIGFTTSEYLTNDLLTGVTYTIEGETNTTFRLSEGEHTVTASKTGYYDLNYTFNVTPLQSETIALTDMYNSLLNVTATTYPTNSTLNNFNISVNNNTYTTTTGYIEIPTLKNRLNTLNITSNGYASRLSQEYTTTAILNTTSYLMYPFNSLRIIIYNGTTDGLLNFQNVTINTISTLTTFENITSTGNITISFLSPLDYELRLESSGYTTTSYFVTVNNDTSTEIKVYMTTNDSNTDTQRVKVIDNGNNPIGSAIVWLQKEDYGTYTTINQRVSGSDGLATFYVNKDIDEYYRFIVIYNGEVKLTTEKTVFVPSIDEIVELVIDTATSAYTIPDRINVNVWLTGTNEEFVNYQFIDPNNVINGARLIITAEDLTTGTISTGYNSTKSGVSGLFSVELDQQNDTIYTMKAYIINSDGTETLYWEGNTEFNITVILDRNTGLLYAILIFIFAAFLTASTMNPLLSGSISLGILLPLTYLKLISIPVGVVTGFIVLFVIVFIKIKTGGNQ